jgi:hypothetical protein
VWRTNQFNDKQYACTVHILAYFELWDTHEYSDLQVTEMREKEGRIPSEQSGFAGAVSDGYTNPMETLSHSFVCKPI